MHVTKPTNMHGSFPLSNALLCMISERPVQPPDGVYTAHRVQEDNKVVEIIKR